MTPRDVQLWVTITALVAAGLLALLCDVVRYRSLGNDARRDSQEVRPGMRTTLVPPN